MNIIFLRHGEATDNVKELISDKEIYWSTLTQNGIETVKKSIMEMPNNIDIMYVSPFPRTIETAHFVYEKYPNAEVIIDNRLREISYGKYTHQKNNEELDNIRKMQIEGDYFTRFGDYGDNRYEIEYRLSEFLNDTSCNENKNVLIVSHGSVISYIKRLLNIKGSRLSKGKVETFNNVNFEYFYKYFEELKKLG